MSYAPGAPAEIWGIKGLDSGCKLTLMLCWSRADHDVQRSPKPTTIHFPHRVYPPGHPRAGEEIPFAECRNLTVAEAIGITPAAVAKHFTILKKRGLARACGRCVDLFPPSTSVDAIDQRRQAIDQRRSAVDDRVDRSVDKPSTSVEGASTSVDKPSTSVDNQLNPPDPPKIPPDPPNDQGTEACFALTSPDPGPAKPRPEVRVGAVIAYFNEQVAALRDWTGLRKSSGVTVTRSHRRAIEDCMSEIDGSDADKISACRKVIDVQIAQARSLGQLPVDATPEARKARLKHVSWHCLSIGVLFRKEKFPRWLERWSADGEHRLFSNDGRAPGTKPRRAGYGAIAEFERMRRESPEEFYRPPDGPQEFEGEIPF